MLVVEDDASLLRAIAACLEQKDFEVMTARNGSDALLRIAETLPDLIVSDVMMPRGDGFALIANLRANPRTDLIPIVFLTAKDGRVNRLNGIRAGVDAYLTKPFEPEELVATIENILTRVTRTHTRGALVVNAQISNSAADDVDFANNHATSDLTEAETRVAWFVAEGLSNKEIAARLNLSIRTIESHVSHILRKKNWSNRVEIARHIAQQKSA